ncbi:phosphoprotein phosphatase [Xenorhabdus stockiae]|uniref:Phosphoprotein phosphatase n=1 Tax=Xenorhabdus stockiae TaxID=351614 RepID=A0A2D0K4T7_9GAMM|nr:lysis protein [Xenorhabdus stockiae]PHM56859.1 phosphoprotein phosphatase [Xenorhabdus stockiae]
MKLNSQYFTLSALVIVSGLFWFYYSEYQDKAEEYRRLKRQYDSQIIAINKQQERIEHLAELDKVHTQELANAKTEIDRLHAISLAHPERVYIKAKCPVPETTTTSGMDDATTARPTDSAIRNYWLLRERIAISEQMILGLQDYVNTECGRKG